MGSRSPPLQSNGQNVLGAAPTPRGQQRTEDTSIAELEKALAARRSKRIPEQVRDGAQTARALLEENRQLIQEKQDRKALARKNSKEFVDKLVAQDRLSTAGEKAQEIYRRHAQQELAKYYKAEIAEKERAKANSYRSKVESGVEIQYFPFVEGDTINRNRETKNAKLREEMQEFLNNQHERHPPRKDPLLAQTSLEHQICYGDDPESSALPGATATPHLNRHPRFLSRAREHLSRRLHDAHVRQALEEKVSQTRAELDALNQQRQAEVLEWKEGLVVNDALRVDISQAKKVERRKHAEFLKSQIEERKERDQREHRERNGQIAGYFGPEEKELQGVEMNRDHCSNLIKQMEVDHVRRSSSRNARLQQERRLVDNCIAEMSQDRAKERQKNQLHREVLTTTWKSQEEIKTTKKAMERF